MKILLTILFYCFLYPFSLILKLFGKVYVSNEYKTKNSYWSKNYKTTNKMSATNAKLPTDLDSDTTPFDALADLNTSISLGDVTVPAASGDVGTVPTLSISSGHNAEYLDALASAKALIDKNLYSFK